MLPPGSKYWGWAVAKLSSAPSRARNRKFFRCFARRVRHPGIRQPVTPPTVRKSACQKHVEARLRLDRSLELRDITIHVRGRGAEELHSLLPERRVVSSVEQVDRALAIPEQERDAGHLAQALMHRPGSPCFLAAVPTESFLWLLTRHGGIDRCPNFWQRIAVAARCWASPAAVACPSDGVSSRFLLREQPGHLWLGHLATTHPTSMPFGNLHAIAFRRGRRRAKRCRTQYARRRRRRG